MSAQDEFNEQLLETLSSLVDKVKELQKQVNSLDTTAPKVEFTGQSDLNIKGMFRYLQAKSIRPMLVSNGIDPHIIECLKIGNDATLDFFKVMFKEDIERMGLFN